MARVTSFQSPLQPQLLGVTVSGARRRGLRAVVAGLVGVAVLPWLAACGTRQAALAPGYYRVRRGDTLTQIARRTGHTVDELRRWNRLSNANRIQVGQVLRVVPPAVTATRPAPAKSAPTKPAPAKPTPAKPAPIKPAQPARPPGITLVRPAQGRVVQGYGGASRGVTIVNAAGTPVVAAAAGSVLYAGDGLRAYGNLVIVGHANNYLTVYAHNRTLLVKQGQRVTQGQKIAEMGTTGSSRVALYFELRYDGQAVDPAGAFKP